MVSTNIAPSTSIVNDDQPRSRAVSFFVSISYEGATARERVVLRLAGCRHGW